MEPNEIAEQLIALAETPEQVQYITSNNNDVLKHKNEQMKSEYERLREQHRYDNQYRRGKEDALKLIILELFRDKPTVGCRYDD
jgi:lipoate synthase